MSQKRHYPFFHGALKPARRGGPNERGGRLGRQVTVKAFRQISAKTLVQTLTFIQPPAPVRPNDYVLRLSVLKVLSFSE